MDWLKCLAPVWFCQALCDHEPDLETDEKNMNLIMITIYLAI